MTIKLYVLIHCAILAAALNARAGTVGAEAITGQKAPNSLIRANIFEENFETGLRAGWVEKKFKNATRYSIVAEAGGRVLKAESSNAASGLIFNIKFDPAEYPIITWRWKIKNILSKGDAAKKSGDDYAARVYVVFPHWFPPKTKSLNYIWANRLPKGAGAPNQFFSNAAMIAVESGNENIGKWVTERRNILDDFKKAFGSDPPMAGAIAVMTDTDQTGESAVAYYDDIRIEAQPDGTNLKQSSPDAPADRGVH